jgi:hypothetical protein
MSPFRQHYDSFDPEILAVLEISFNDPQKIKALVLAALATQPNGL